MTFDPSKRQATLEHRGLDMALADQVFAGATIIEPDDAPDLSRSPWKEKLAAPVRRGRPPLASPKVSTTIRLDADIVAAYKLTGPCWQSKINATLRQAIKRF
jgi:uncharacterized protein (DUF4415 family)